MNPQTLTKIEIEKIQFKNHKLSTPLFIKLEDVVVPFTIKKFDKNWSLSLNVVDPTKLKEIEQSFRQKVGETDFEFKTNIIEDQEGKFRPSIRVKIPMKNDKFDFDCYDTNGKEIEMNEKLIVEYFKKGTHLNVIIQLNCYVWEAKNMYGITYTLVQVKQLEEKKVFKKCVV